MPNNKITLHKIKLVLAIACSLFINSISTEASLIDDFKPDSKVFNIQAENLKEPVNINFHETELSNVLLMLAKIADINLVFPQELDRKITIKLKDRAVFDAIKDLLDICKLKYNFERNTLSVSNQDLSEVQNQSIEIIYNNAEDIAKLVNETLFNQIKNSQPAESPKPFASVFPNKNFVIVSGNSSQIQAAKDYIKKLDQKPEINYYAPSFLKVSAMKTIIDEQFMHSDIESAIKDGVIYLRGNKKAVDDAINLLQSIDRSPTQMYLE